LGRRFLLPDQHRLSTPALSICNTPSTHRTTDYIYTHIKNMTSKGWFNLETAGAVVPESAFFEGDSAFSFLGLTRTQRLYGFAGW
jgi:hypothetical protein